MRGNTFFEGDVFETAIERYGVWPVTVWEISDTNPSNRKLKKSLGDLGITRSHSKASHSYKTSNKPNKLGTTTSIFPPILAVNIINLYAKKWKAVKIYDPFAGGGCRAIVAAKAGLHYTGVEIRKDEVNNILKLAKHHGVSESIKIVHGDARNPPNLKPSSFDFCYTCPPYWNLEQYEGGKDDLSMIGNYDKFCAEIGKVIKYSHKVLKPNSISCWVVGLHRNKNGELAPMHHDVVRLHKEHGFKFREEIIVYRNNKMPLTRVGNFEKGGNLLVRLHEYCLVFERL